MSDLFNLAKAFFKKDMLIFSSYKFNLILRALSLFVYFIFIFFFSNIVDFDSSINRETYLLYSIIGIGVADFCLSISIGGSHQVYLAKQNGTLEDLNASTFSIKKVLIMMYIFPALMAFIRLILYLLIIIIYSLYFNDYKIDYLKLLIFLIYVFIGFFAYFGIGLISISFILVFNRGDPIAYLNSLSAFLIGGVFYPVSILPQSLEVLSGFLPLTYIIETLRSISMNNYSNSVNYLYENLFPLMILSFFYFIIGLIVLSYSIKLSRKIGAFSNY